MLKIVQFLIGFGFVIIGAYVLYQAVGLYHESRNVGLPRLWDAAYGSATKLWAKFVMLLAAIVANLDTAADILGMPEMRGHIDMLLGNPKIVAGIMLGISIVTLRARSRTS